VLARSEDRAASALGPFGIADEVEVSVGDVTDPESVEKAMQGCGAVLHAASTYSFDVRAARQLRSVNVGGTEVVLGTAERLGLDPIVHVSSFGVFFPPGGRLLAPDLPVNDPPGAYFRSKADAERIARSYQERGAPVVSSYPGGALGPLDPHFGENGQLVTNILKRRMPVIPPGGLCFVDVRDLARAHARMFQPGRGPRRYLMTGANIAFASIIETLAELTGRRLPHVRLPAMAVRPVVQVTSLLQHIVPVRLPFNREGFDAVVWDAHGDDSRARAELGFGARPLRETLADTVVWLRRSGKISARQAGELG